MGDENTGSSVVFERERAPGEAPTHADQQHADQSSGDDGLSEFQRHKQARGYPVKPGQVPPKPGAAPQLRKPDITAQGPKKAGAVEPDAATPDATAPDAATPDAATPDAAPNTEAKTDAKADLDAQTEIVDPDSHERYDGRTKAGKRIKQLLTQRAQERGRIAELQQQLADLQRRIEGNGSNGQAPHSPNPSSAAAQPGNPDDPAPRLDDFESYDQYARAVARWEARQELAEREQAERAKAEDARKRQQFQQAYEGFQKRVPDALSRYPDFAEVLGRLPMTPREQHITRRVLESEVGPDFAYFLGTHPEVWNEIMSAPSLADHLRLIGRYEAEVERAVKGGTSQSATVSRAPAPVRPVATSSGAGNKDKNPDEMDAQEWRRRRGFGPSFNRY